ncbi:unnamed protein product [Brachionus calyciflorus]|uniref:Reverse transcriptase domain-containing protein n=1 Tax=Brachionus calyciflorus TaxID=104777 RepID=A0A813M487_9BILA|nr:unnamed protein product [Brachionus calyciflorus]
MCSLDSDKQNLKLGELGKIIEIDESLNAKVKHGKGKDLKRPQVWVLGLVQRKDSSTNGSFSSKCDSDVANLKDLDDDNQEVDDDINSNDNNNIEEDTEIIDEETNTLAKSDSLTQKNSTVYDEEDEKLNQISENMNTLVIRSVKETAIFYKDLSLSRIPVLKKTENEVKKKLSKHNNPVACDLYSELMKNEKVNSFTKTDINVNMRILWLMKLSTITILIRQMYILQLKETIHELFWRVLLNYNSVSCIIIKYENQISEIIRITEGVKQGGVLSPHLFNFFIELVQAFTSLKIGCRIRINASIIGYCDDIVLLSPTKYNLQILLKMCGVFGRLWRINFNPTKSDIISKLE